MELHGLLREPELLGDLLVGHPVTEGAQDRKLTIAQADLVRARRLNTLRFAEDRLRDGSLNGLPECGRQVTRIHLLPDERNGPARERRADDGVLVDAGQDDRLDARMSLPQKLE